METDSPMALAMEAEPATDVCSSDRFIPSRGTVKTGSRKLERDENAAPSNGYQEVLSQNVLGKESLSDVKILSYKHKLERQQAGQSELKVLYSCNRDGVAPRRTAQRVVPQSATKVLDAPGILDDFYSHPLDWSSRNVVAVALTDTVFIFDVASGRAEKLLTMPDSNTLVNSLRWTGEGFHLGVGTSTGEVQIWDAAQRRQLRSLRGRAGRIGALAWHEHVLSCGALDGEVHHHDVRAREHLVGRLAGAHQDLVCGLDYSLDGILASGSNDNTVCIWDRHSSREPLQTLTEHRAAVKALRWCPWQRHVLATGGGSADRQVCLWNASGGRLLAKADAESQVTGVVWGRQERELVTSHGYSKNQLSLWKYPSLAKSTDLEGHGARILDLAQSPDGSLVCSASADETLRFWRVFSPAPAEARRPPEAFKNPISMTIR